MAFTTGQAGGQLQQLAALPAEYSADTQELARAQRLANMLSSTPMPEGQMVSGRFVPPSWTQQLAGLVNAGTGAYFANEAEEKQTKLANKLREDRLGTQQGVMDAINKGDTKTALAIASSRPEFAKEFIAPLMANVIPKAGESKVVGNTLIGPDGKVIYKAPKEFAPHAPQMVQTENGMMMFDPNNRSFTPATDAQGKPIMGAPSAALGKEFTELNQQKSIINGVLKGVESNREAFGPKIGAIGMLPAGDVAQNRKFTPAQLEARSEVFNTASAVIKERAGTAQSASEKESIMRFLPSPLDSADVIISKFNGYNRYIENKEKGTSSVRGAVPAYYGKTSKEQEKTPATTTATPAANNAPLKFATEADAAKAKLKDGTPIVINGVAGVWKD